MFLKRIIGGGMTNSRVQEKIGDAAKAISDATGSTAVGEIAKKSKELAAALNERRAEVEFIVRCKNGGYAEYLGGTIGSFVGFVFGMMTVSLFGRSVNVRSGDNECGMECNAYITFCTLLGVNLGILLARYALWKVISISIGGITEFKKMYSDLEGSQYDGIPTKLLLEKKEKTS